MLHARIHACNLSLYNTVVFSLQSNILINISSDVNDDFFFHGAVAMDILVTPTISGLYVYIQKHAVEILYSYTTLYIYV